MERNLHTSCSLEILLYTERELYNTGSLQMNPLSVLPQFGKIKGEERSYWVEDSMEVLPRFVLKRSRKLTVNRVREGWERVECYPPYTLIYPKEESEGSISLGSPSYTDSIPLPQSAYPQWLQDIAPEYLIAELRFLKGSFREAFGSDQEFTLSPKDWCISLRAPSPHKYFCLFSLEGRLLRTSIKFKNPWASSDIWDYERLAEEENIRLIERGLWEEGDDPQDRYQGFSLNLEPQEVFEALRYMKANSLGDEADLLLAASRLGFVDTKRCIRESENPTWYFLSQLNL